MFYQLGSYAYRFRRLVIGVWLLFFAASLPFIPQLPSVLKVGGFTSDEIESTRARNLLQETLPSFSPAVLVVIFESSGSTADQPEFVEQAEHALARVVEIPEVVSVTTFRQNPVQVASDGLTAYTLVQLSLSPEESQRLMPEIRERLQDTQLKTTLAGSPAFFEDVERLSEQDLQRAELLAIPFALIALILVFGTIVGAAVPVVVGGVSVATVLGLIYFVAGGIDLSIFVLNLATMLGLGLAIDYSLFMTSRFREELEERGVQEAVVVTTGTAGRAVFFSGLTVLIGLAGLTFFPYMFLRSVGIAGILVVGVSVVGALTLLPAVLGVVGSRVNALQVIRRRPGIEGSFWVRLSNLVMDHPWRVLLPTLGLLLALGLPFLGANLSSPDPTILPTSVASRQGFEVLRDEFGDGEISPIVIAVESQSSITSPDNIEALYRFTRDLAANEQVMRIESLVTVDPRLTLDQYQVLYANLGRGSDPFVSETYARLASPTTTVVFVYPRELSGSDASKQLLATIRNYPIQGDLDLLVTGGTAEIVDVVDNMYADFPLIALGIVVATYLILLYQFRSILLPLKAILMNALSIVASYGAIVFIFQEGNFASLLRFEPLGFVEASLPIIMFCILFGLSMDYEVFLLSRVREAYLETGDNRASVALGLQRSGRIITGAALIVVVVTASFATADIVLVKAFGVGIAVAILVDSTIVRALLVPATMRLLGSWNWWLPGWLRAILPKKEFLH
jgi:RND superfamily putative drug exporter